MLYAYGYSFEDCKQECTSYDWCSGIRTPTDGSQCGLLTSGQVEWDSTLGIWTSTVDGWESSNYGNWSVADEWKESGVGGFECYEKIEPGTVV